jgi:ParB-like chromosome segregation protein Spo0J
MSKQNLDPRELKTDPFFEAAFPPDPQVLPTITADMRERGYHGSPIEGWRPKGRGPVEVIDGHTRLRAALDAGLPSVPVEVTRYADRSEALRLALSAQAHRRNLGRESIAVASIQALATIGEHRTKSAQALAEELACSKPTVDRARTLVEAGSETEIAKVREGKIGLKDAVAAIQARERLDRSEGERETVVPEAKPEAPAEVEPEREDDLHELKALREAVADLDDAIAELTTHVEREQRHVLRSAEGTRTDLLAGVDGALGEVRAALRGFEEARKEATTKG